MNSCRNLLALSLMVFAMASFFIDSAHAQMIKTPMGDLRIGMSEEEASVILHTSAQEIGGIDMMGQRRLSATVGGRTFAASATNKHVIYSVSSTQFFPTAVLGRRAAEQVFQQYLNEYGALTTVTANTEEAGVTSYRWGIAGGAGIAIELRCSDTVVVVEIADYKRKAADDGEDSLRFQRMGFGPDFDCF